MAEEAVATPAAEAAPAAVTPVALDLGAFGTDGQPAASDSSAPPDTGTPAEGHPPPNWREGVSEEYASDPSLADIGSLDDMVKSYIHGQRLIGKGKIAVPGEDATPEDWDAVYDTLGRPEDPQGYEIGAPDKTPDGFVYNDAHEATMRELFHKEGLTNKQASAIWSKIQEETATNFEGFYSGVKERLTAEHAQLNKEWGVKRAENLELANWVAQEFGGEEFVKFLNESKIGQEPQFLRVAAAVGAKLGEDRQNVQTKSSGALTPPEALSKIAAIQSDPKNAYHVKDAPGHQEAVDKMAGLFAMAYPEEVKP